MGKASRKKRKTATAVSEPGYSSLSADIRTTVLLGAAVLLLTLLVYWQVARFDFVHIDDQQYVYRNASIQNGLTVDGLKWAFTTNYAGNWHPLTWISHMLDIRLFGMNSGGHHFTNLVIHLAVALLLYLSILKMTGRPWVSAFVMGMFAVHPLHVESVAWVSERKDLLCALFWFLTMNAYLRYAQKPSLWRYFAVFAGMTLAILSKPMAVTLPVILLLMDWWPLNRFAGLLKPLSLVIEKFPLFVLSAVSAVMTVRAQGSGGAIGDLYTLPLGERLANAATATAAYLLKIVWPNKLAVFYPHPHSSLPEWQTAVSILVITVITFFAVRFVKQRPYILFGWLWYLVTLVPVIGIVQVGAQAMADRYTYIPLTGIFLIVALGVPDVLRLLGVSNRQKITAAAGAASLIILSVVCHRQAALWADSVTLFSHTLQVTQNNWSAHQALGSALLDGGKSEEAIPHFKEAIRLRPGYADAYADLGKAMENIGKREEAFGYYLKAIEYNPRHAVAHNNIGGIYYSRGDTGKAIIHIRKALEADPLYADARYNLGVTLASAGKKQEAIEAYRVFLNQQPDHYWANNNLGLLLVETGRKAEGISLIEKAVKIDPKNPAAKQNLDIVR